MKTFRELSENSFPVANLLKGIEQDVSNLESIIKRYGKDGFVTRMMSKGEYGDFTKEGKKIVKAAEEALAIIQEDFHYTIGQDNI